MNENLSIPVAQLRWTCDPETFEALNPNDPQERDYTPGQHRAVRALEIGLGLRSRGYNVFLAGAPGTHRSETLHQLFKTVEQTPFEPEDFCFVHNFSDAEQPRLLRFHGGQGCEFRDSMEEAVDRIREGIPKLLTSEVHAKRRKARVKRFRTKMEELAQPLREKATPEGLALVQVTVGDSADAELLPLIADEPVAFEDLEVMVERDEFPKPELTRLIKARENLIVDLRRFSETADQLAAAATKELAELDKEMTRPLLKNVLRAVHSKFHHVEAVVDYLREVQDFVEKELDIFRRAEGQEGEDDETHEAARLLTVNLVLNRKGVTERPILVEQNPSVGNLRGTIDREVLPGGRVLSNFSHIKAGSLLRAHGGFLVLHADDLESEGLGAWSLIKRTLRTEELRIELEGSDQGSGPRAIRPEAIPVDVKVVIIGSPELYHSLLDADPDFSKLFKIKAEFDSEMELSPQSLQDYARLARSVCETDKLPGFTKDGIGALVEYGVRLAGQRNRISTRFTKIEDLVRESAYWAGREDKTEINANFVHRALEERRTRVNLYEEKTHRLIREGTIYIDTEGSAVGQINGLTVLDLGNHRFGRPARITASVAAGTTGIVNVERRVELSGSYHDKGVLILSGFLQETFAQDHPIAMNASITLEQSYSEVDGDSATMAEALALLSALSHLPIRQDLAVTASMDQKGRIQPVGGLNEKIEGFFDLCAGRGLTGTQGVLIPRANLANLMLRPRVVKAVEEGNFHVYAVQNIFEAVELTMGTPSGQVPDSSGNFPKDSVFAKVASRLSLLSDKSRQFLPWPGR